MPDPSAVFGLFAVFFTVVVVASVAGVAGVAGVAANQKRKDEIRALAATRRWGLVGPAFPGQIGR